MAQFYTDPHNPKRKLRVKAVPRLTSSLCQPAPQQPTLMDDMYGPGHNASTAKQYCRAIDRYLKGFLGYDAMSGIMGNRRILGTKR